MSVQLSLRERKKLKAMRHIQEVAMGLFDEYGYGQITIERIAAEAEVSPSSIYRYFGTKEYIVLYDEYDPIAVQALDDALAAHDPVPALRQVITGIVEGMVDDDDELVRRRMTYTMTEPAVRAGMYRLADEMSVQIREILARNTGRRVNDLEVWVFTSAIMSAFLAAIEYWYETGYRESLLEVLDRALTVMGGFTFE